MRTGAKNLEFEFQRELNLAGISIRSVNLSKARPKDGVRWKPHVHDVEEIKKLSPELKVCEVGSGTSSSYRRVLYQREVVVVIGWPSKGIPSESSKPSLIRASTARNINRD